MREKDVEINNDNIFNILNFLIKNNFKQIDTDGVYELFRSLYYDNTNNIINTLNELYEINLLETFLISSKDSYGRYINIERATGNIDGIEYFGEKTKDIPLELLDNLLEYHNSFLNKKEKEVINILTNKKIKDVLRNVTEDLKQLFKTKIDNLGLNIILNNTPNELKNKNITKIDTILTKIISDLKDELEKLIKESKDYLVKNLNKTDDFKKELENINNIFQTKRLELKEKIRGKIPNLTGKLKENISSLTKKIL